MHKGAPDRNFDKVLAEIEKHPAVLKRAQEIYLYKVTQRATAEALAKHFKVSIGTIYKYCNAYKPIAHKYSGEPELRETLLFVSNEIFRLNLRRNSADINAQEYATLTREIRNYLAIECELLGFTQKQPAVQINFVQNVTNKVIEVVNRHVPDACIKEKIAEELRMLGAGD